MLNTRLSLLLSTVKSAARPNLCPVLTHIYGSLDPGLANLVLKLFKLLCFHPQYFYHRKYLTKNTMIHAGKTQPPKIQTLPILTPESQAVKAELRLESAISPRNARPRASPSQAIITTQNCSIRSHTDNIYRSETQMPGFIAWVFTGC